MILPTLTPASPPTPNTAQSQPRERTDRAPGATDAPERPFERELASRTQERTAGDAAPSETQPEAEPAPEAQDAARTESERPEEADAGVSEPEEPGERPEEVDGRAPGVVAPVVVSIDQRVASLTTETSEATAPGDPVREPRATTRSNPVETPPSAPGAKASSLQGDTEASVTSEQGAEPASSRPESRGEPVRAPAGRSVNEHSAERARESRGESERAPVGRSVNERSAERAPEARTKEASHPRREAEPVIRPAEPRPAQTARRDQASAEPVRASTAPVAGVGAESGARDASSDAEDRPAEDRSRHDVSPVPPADTREAGPARDQKPTAREHATPNSHRVESPAPATEVSVPSVHPAESAPAVRTPSLATPTATDSNSDTPPVDVQVARGIGAVLRQRGGSVVLRLAPESLGTVKVSMRIERGNVSLDLEATTEKAHSALAKELGSLTNSLESKGMRVERANIHLAPTQHAAPAQQGESSARQDQQHGDQQDAPDHREQEARDQRREQRENRRDERGFDGYAQEAQWGEVEIGINARA